MRTFLTPCLLCAGAFGWSFGSRAAAESVALASCRKHAGDCVIPIWFRNACGALAVRWSGCGSGWGTSRKLDESYALPTCRRNTSGCEIKRWACTAR
jgi:uncharacterized protein DUF4189